MTWLRKLLWPPRRFHGRDYASVQQAALTNLRRWQVYRAGNGEWVAEGR